MYFLSEHGDDAVCEEENGRQVFIYRQIQHFFVEKKIKVLFQTFCIDLACKQICFPPRVSYK